VRKLAVGLSALLILLFCAAMTASLYFTGIEEDPALVFAGAGIIFLACAALLVVYHLKRGRQS
jgi:hypothetical protein